VNVIEGLAGLFLVVLCAVMMLIFMWVYRKRQLYNLRTILMFNNLRQAIGLAVEDGSRLHVSLGKASLNIPQMASSLVGLVVLQRIAQATAHPSLPAAMAAWPS
jgi:presenilin-like A22 family membrane protease